MDKRLESNILHIKCTYWLFSYFIYIFSNKTTTKTAKTLSLFMFCFIDISFLYLLLTAARAAVSVIKLVLVYFMTSTAKYTIVVIYDCVCAAVRQVYNKLVSCFLFIFLSKKCYRVQIFVERQDERDDFLFHFSSYKVLFRLLFFSLFNWTE